MEQENRRRKIAVILSNMDGEYVYLALRGIEKEAREHNMELYIFNSSAGTDETIKHNIGEYHIYKLINYSEFDGVILFGNLIQGYSVYSNVIEQIKASGVVTVSIDGEIDGFCSLGCDDYSPMKSIVTHLIEEHHYTKINYISGQDFNTDSVERLQGYCEALQEHGIPVEEERIFKGAFTNVHGIESAKKMLENPNMMPEAVVCATDSIAIGVRNVFSNAGIKMPQQVAITGFDDIFEARNFVPRLTTVARDPEQMGAEAIHSILKLMNGEEVPVRQDFPATPVYRESCGCSAEEEDTKELQYKYAEKAYIYDRFLRNCNMQIESLNAAKDFEDYLERLKFCIKRSDSESMYLCLNKDLVEELRCTDVRIRRGGKWGEYQTEGFSETMSLVLAYENGKFTEEGDFPLAQMVPKIPKEGEPIYSYIFSPIHFREHCMGYLVARNSRNVRFSSSFRSWIINLSNSLESLRKQMRLQGMVERLDSMYVTDSLTGLYNRFGFNRYAKESFSRCVAQGESCMILFVDLDGLKTINDNFGHDNGDVAISLVAYAIQNACKEAEICARIGGDEFVVYAEGYSEKDAVSYCKRLEKLLHKANTELKKPYRIEASYGFEVVFPDAGDTLERYVDVADSKMYVNKQKKRG